MFLLVRGVGNTDIPDSRTRGPPRVWLGVGNKKKLLPDSRTRGSVALAVTGMGPEGPQSPPQELEQGGHRPPKF